MKHTPWTSLATKRVRGRLTVNGVGVSAKPTSAPPPSPPPPPSRRWAYMAGCNVKGTSAAVRRALHTHGMDIWGPPVCAPPRLQLVRLVVADDLLAQSAHALPRFWRRRSGVHLLTVKLPEIRQRVDRSAHRAQRRLRERDHDVDLVRDLLLREAPAARRLKRDRATNVCCSAEGPTTKLRSPS